MHSFRAEAQEKGWIVSRYARPEEIPCLYHNQGRVLLTVEGGFAEWPKTI